MKMTVAEIATLVGGDLCGDPNVVITGLNGVDEARPGELCFIRSARYLPQLNESNASAVLIREVPENLAIPAIIVDSPDLAFAAVLKHCETAAQSHPQGIHPSAVIHPDATLGTGVALGACAVIEAGVRLEQDVVVFAGCYIGRDSHLGAGTVVYPNVTIRESTSIGARCIIHAGASIGSDGFGYAHLNGQWMKIPQVGRVILEDDVEVGSCTAIDRATFGETRIGRGTKIDNLVQIGHNVRIGEHCALAGMVGIAGSAILEDGVQVGASAGLKGHLTVGQGATVAARSGVVRDVEPGTIVSGFPAIEHNEERRVLVAQRRVPELIRRIKALERALDLLKEQLQ